MAREHFYCFLFIYTPWALARPTLFFFIQFQQLQQSSILMWCLHFHLKLTLYERVNFIFQMVFMAFISWNCYNNLNNKTSFHCHANRMFRLKMHQSFYFVNRFETSERKYRGHHENIVEFRKKSTWYLVSS